LFEPPGLVADLGEAEGRGRAGELVQTIADLAEVVEGLGFAVMNETGQAGQFRQFQAQPFGEPVGRACSWRCNSSPGSVM